MAKALQRASWSEKSFLDREKWLGGADVMSEGIQFLS